jgi:small subunit ribosomal protein S4
VRRWLPHVPRAADDIKGNQVARYLGPKAKLSRREGTDLFLKSARRSIADKAKFDSKPGQHGRTSGPAPPTTVCSCAKSRRSSACTACWKAVPPLLRRSRPPPGNTGANLLSCWSPPGQRGVPHGLRLDPRRSASAGVAQGHHRERQSVNIPSYLVKAGDVVAVREKSKKQARVVEALQLAEQVGFPAWVEVNADKAEGTFKKCRTATNSAPTSTNR